MLTHSLIASYQLHYVNISILQALMHYENKPLQYTVVLKAVKMVIFRLINAIFFLIFSQNIDRGYTLGPPH